MWFSAVSRALGDEAGLERMIPYYLSFEHGGLSWIYYHSIFTILDVLQLTTQTLEYLLEKNPTFHSVDQAHLDAASIDIKAIMGICWATIHTSVTSIINKLREPGVAAMMVENTIEMDESLIGWNLKDLIGMPALVDIASDICSSWAEGLEAAVRLTPTPT